MPTNTRIVLERTSYDTAAGETYKVREVIGSLDPKVGWRLNADDVQRLINDRRNTVVIRAARGIEMKTQVKKED